MDHLERMRQAKEIPAHAFLQFLQHYDSQPNRIFCFVEATVDKNFYNAHIRKILPQTELITYTCGNKAGVLHVYKLIRERREFDAEKFGFFIDRDFDSPCHIGEIYETPCYSIENFFTSPSTIQNILDDVFHIPHTSKDKQQFIELYLHLLEEFLGKVEIFNCWLYSHAIKRQTENVEAVLHVKTRIDKTIKKNI
jgi:hypothetical protein